jgi:hypothetical protein
MIVAAELINPKSNSYASGTGTETGISFPSSVFALSYVDEVLVLMRIFAQTSMKNIREVIIQIGPYMSGLSLTNNPSFQLKGIKACFIHSSTYEVVVLKKGFKISSLTQENPIAFSFLTSSF